MAKYIVTETYEFYVSYEVEAGSRNEAVDILADGDPDFFREVRRDESECIRVDAEEPLHLQAAMARKVARGGSAVVGEG